jgi:hypothetical protein
MSSDIRPEDAPFDGRWWSDDPSHVVGGRLELKGDVWQVTLLGWLGPWNGRGEDNNVPGLVHGQIGTTPVALLDLVPGGWSTSGNDPPYETRISVNTVIVGLHATPATRFKRAGVRLLHLNEWANRRPWSFEHGSSNAYQESVTFSDPGQLTAELPGATASLWRPWGREGGGLSSVTMTSDEWVYFDFDTPIDLEAVEHDWVRPLRNLIELAAAKRSPVIELTVLHEGADVYTSDASVLSAVSRRPLPQPKHSFQLLFTLDDVDFLNIVPAWWKLHSQIGVIADLTAALRGGGNASSQFLTGASAIEGYHRHRHGQVRAPAEHKARVKQIVEAAPVDDRAWLKQKLAFSHEPTFEERVDAVVTRAGSLFPPAVGDVDAWRRWVKAGRNSVAHRDPQMVDLDKEWRTTVRVTATIGWLMTLVLLRDVGIPDAVIELGIRRERGLEAATQYLREVKPDWFP